MAFPAQWERSVDDSAVGQAERRRPIWTVGPDRNSRWYLEQVRDDSRLFDKLTASRSPRRLPSLNRSAGWHPTPPPVLHQQDIPKSLIKHPDFG